MADSSFSLFDLEDDTPSSPKELKRKVVFFPFESRVEGYPGHYTYPNRFKEKPGADPIKSWQNIVSTVCSDDTANKKSGTLGLLTAAKDTLYIMGQCAAGSERLYSLDLKHSIEADGIVKLLKDYLKKEFAGKVKVFACHSATGGESGGESFAKRLASAMRTEGYTKAFISGITPKCPGLLASSIRATPT